MVRKIVPIHSDELSFETGLVRDLEDQKLTSTMDKKLDPGIVKQRRDVREKASLKGSRLLRRRRQGEFIIESRSPSSSSDLVHHQITKFVYFDRPELRSLSKTENWEPLQASGENLIFDAGNEMLIALSNFGKAEEGVIQEKLQKLSYLRDHGAPILPAIGYLQISDGNFFMVYDLVHRDLTVISRPERFSEDQGITLAKKMLSSIKELRSLGFLHGAPRISNVFVREETLSPLFIGTRHTKRIEEEGLSDLDSEIFFALANLLNAGILKGVHLLPEVLESFYGSKNGTPKNAVARVQNYRKFVGSDLGRVFEKAYGFEVS